MRPPMSLGVMLVLTGGLMLLISRLVSRAPGAPGRRGASAEPQARMESNGIFPHGERVAGPTAGLLLPDLLTPQRIEGVSSQVRSLASSVEGDDFWIRGRPFLLSFGPDYPEEFEELAATGLPAVIGWTPRDAVNLSAMGHRDEDHRLLGELCVTFASQLGGLVHFGGDLEGLPTLPVDCPSTALRVESLGGLAGSLFAAPFEYRPGQYGTLHLGDAEFLRAWLRHPRFHLVK